MIKSCLYGFLAVFFFAGALFLQMPYYGPTSPGQGIQLQLMIYDQPELGGLKIESATFNGRSINLQPPDLYGFRGGGGFQLQPGKYRLEWRVSKDKMAWPRTVSYKQTIEVRPRDTWVQVTVKGDKATVL